MNYFSQVCGFIVLAAAIASMQLKNMKHVLVCQLICNGVGAASYILVGGLSGCGIYLIALLQTVVYALFNFREKKAPLYIAVMFITLYIVCSLATYRDFNDLFSMVAATTCGLSLIQKRASVYRFFMLLNGIVWMIYDLSIGAHLMLLSHIATAVSAGVGIIRFDIRRKSDGKTNREGEDLNGI